MVEIIIAETGQPPGSLAEEYGDYGEMTRKMLMAHGADTVSVIRVFGEAPSALPPPSPDRAMLITGSPAGVYEPHPWIPPLEASVRDWLAAGRPVVGICFGHQLMAQAMGGRVEKSPKGWGVGVHTYDTVVPHAVIADVPSRFACAVSHQDQVVEVPAGAERLAGSAFCPNGVLAYANGAGVSFQMHPEFDPAFGQALMDIRAGCIAPDTFQLGKASYRSSSDRLILGQTITDFLKGV